MTQEEYNKFEKQLTERGYRRFERTLSNEDWNFFKSFGKSKYEEGRSNYQLCFSIFDFPKYDRMDENVAKNPKSFMCYVLVSRTVDERIDIMLASGGRITIDEAEERAASFFHWVEENIPITNKMED